MRYVLTRLCIVMIIAGILADCAFAQKALPGRRFETNLRRLIPLCRRDKLAWTNFGPRRPLPICGQIRV